jgi:hypothetical protein
MQEKSANGIEDRTCPRSSVGSSCSLGGTFSLLQDVNDTILTGSRQSHVIRREDGKRHVTQQLCSSITSHPTPTRNFLYRQQSAVNCTF